VRDQLSRMDLIGLLSQGGDSIIDVCPDRGGSRNAAGDLLKPPFSVSACGCRQARTAEGIPGAVPGFRHGVFGVGVGRARDGVCLVKAGWLQVVRHLTGQGSEPEGFVAGPLGSGFTRGRLTVPVASSAPSGQQVATPPAKAELPVSLECHVRP